MNGEIHIAPKTVYEDSYSYNAEENILKVQKIKNIRNIFGESTILPKRAGVA